MSYDISLRIDTGGEFLARVGNSYSYTYNVAPMFVKAFRDESGLYSLYDVTGKAAIPLLICTINYFNKNENELNKLNTNDWGSAEGAKEFLKLFLEECEKHPKAKIAIL